MSHTSISVTHRHAPCLFHAGPTATYFGCCHSMTPRPRLVALTWRSSRLQLLLVHYPGWPFPVDVGALLTRMQPAHQVLVKICQVVV